MTYRQFTFIMKQKIKEEKPLTFEEYRKSDVNTERGRVASHNLVCVMKSKKGFQQD
jgi:hypothetical protein